MQKLMKRIAAGTLIVGSMYNLLMNNRADYRKSWYQQRTWEPGLYEKLQVKNWKGKMPTYDPDLFDPRKHSWDEIAQAMCQSELVHETIVVFSFLPIFASAWFGSIGVFVITSVIAAVCTFTYMTRQASFTIQSAFRKRMRRRTSMRSP